MGKRTGWNRAAHPRCLSCGGMLDRLYLRKGKRWNTGAFPNPNVAFAQKEKQSKEKQRKEKSVQKQRDLSPSSRRPNKYPGVCKECLCVVPALAGILGRISGVWYVWCEKHIPLATDTPDIDDDMDTFINLPNT